jgi:hypothetical protein
MWFVIAIPNKKHTPIQFDAEDAFDCAPFRRAVEFLPNEALAASRPSSGFYLMRRQPVADAKGWRLSKVMEYSAQKHYRIRGVQFVFFGFKCRRTAHITELPDGKINEEDPNQYVLVFGCNGYHSRSAEATGKA